ncbi:MAG: hypothetical protein Q7R80_01965 [bacterium]|nr:hypothetical protein [bacterium]
MAAQPTPSASDQSTRNFAALSDALIARLAAEIPLDQSDAALAQAAGVDVAEVAKLPPLDPEQERQLVRITWQSVAESCISSMVHALFDAAAKNQGQTRFVDEDLERIAAAHISAPFCAGRFGLDASQQHKAAELTVEIFRDRTRFADRTFFNMDGRVYRVERINAGLFVNALRSISIRVRVP